MFVFILIELFLVMGVYLLNGIECGKDKGFFKNLFVRFVNVVFKNGFDGFFVGFY